MATKTNNAIAGQGLSAAIEAPTGIHRSHRFESLDVFRGLTIAAMVLVNDPGTWNAVYWPLEHADELMSEHQTGWYPGARGVNANGGAATQRVCPLLLIIVAVW